MTPYPASSPTAGGMLALLCGVALRSPSADGLVPPPVFSAAPDRRGPVGSVRSSSLRSAVADADTNSPVGDGTTSPAGPSGGVPDEDERQYWEIGATFRKPARPLTDDLRAALKSGTHPTESQSDLGRGLFVASDWREAWYTYGDDDETVDPETGSAEYEITDIEGEIPEDLSGALYRNGPGKFGVGGERVQHTLDADGLIVKITIPPVADECSVDGEDPDNLEEGAKRRVMFRSRFIETKEFVEEREAGEFIYRSTFGSGPRAFFDKGPKKGLNADPSEPGALSRLVGRAMKTDIKNSANTQVISFGGKVLALFEAGLPYAIDPETLETLGEDDLGGVLQSSLPVKLGDNIPDSLTPDFIGGTAHTAHPNMCPRTGRLVGWHWSQLPLSKSLEVTITEWSPEDFSAVARSTFELPGCELAPHDICLTDNCVLMKVNSLSMDQGAFLSGLKGPAACLEMDGRANVKLHVLPRPGAEKQFEPYEVEIPACFSIHFSHGYEDPETGNIVSFFSGWPPSDSKDFLGAWGGFSPEFSVIPVTNIWRMEIDPKERKCVDLSVAPGSANACAEHPLVHPNFTTRKAKNVYCSASNVVGDSSAPQGFCRLRVEDGSKQILTKGEFNSDIDAYWFGSRCFGGEPIIVPKKGGDPEREEEAYLLGMVKDSARDRSFLAIFDLERPLRSGPVCKLWFKTGVPHGIHGCFAEDGGGAPSVFC